MLVSGKDAHVGEGPDHELRSKLAGKQFDMVIDAVGSVTVIRQGLPFLKRGGKMCIYGVLHKGEHPVPINLMKNNATLHLLQYPVGEHALHDEVVALVKSGKIILKDFYSDTVVIGDFRAGYEKALKREAFKVVVTI